MWPSIPSNPLLPWQALCLQVSCQSHQQHMARLPEGTQDPLLSQQHLTESRWQGAGRALETREQIRHRKGKTRLTTAENEAARKHEH